MLDTARHDVAMRPSRALDNSPALLAQWRGREAFKLARHVFGGLLSRG